MATLGGARPGAGRPKTKNTASAKSRLDYLKDKFGPEFEERIKGLTARQVLELAMEVALYHGDTPEAARFANILIQYEEAKPAQKSEVTVNGLQSKSKEELEAIISGVQSAVNNEHRH